ncbi:hypothetical protein [Lacinutrix himadriensis]|uniref:hypothetical protein n=1 Tax=Lacinutrix himadriensis TaxID=641549 RepID=UPI0006E137B7|nr:hypothetical protein [Lacinutrix himadriensis]
MKKIRILFLCFFTAINFSNAQTKKETIKWLDTYPKLLQDNDKYYSYSGFSGYQLDFFTSEKDGVANLTWMEKSNTTPPYYQRTNVEKIYRIVLFPTEKSNKKWYKLRLICEEGVSNIMFIFKSKDSALRVYKAIKHLTTFYDTDIEFDDQVSLEDKF